MVKTKKIAVKTKNYSIIRIAGITGLLLAGSAAIAIILMIFSLAQ